jgi:DNA repair protein RecO
MSQQAIEAIILKAVPFEEQTQILTLFSKEYGKISLVLKKQKKTNREGLGPLLLVEAEVMVSEKELWKTKNYDVINSFPRLRQRLDTLRHAAASTQFLAKILPLHAPAPTLYRYFHEYLTHLSNFTDPQVATTCFLAKLCALEGVLGENGRLSSEEVTLCLEMAKTTFEDLYSFHCDQGLAKKLVMMCTR